MSLRRFAGASLIAALLLALPALLAGRAFAQEDELPGVRGRLYESPGYGFAVVWDPATWTAIDAVSEPFGEHPYDMLTLDRDDAMIVIEAWTSEETGFSADLRGCVEEQLAYLQDLEGLSGFETVEPSREMPGSLGFAEIGRWRAVSTEPDGTTQSLDIGIECGQGGSDGTSWFHRETRFALDLLAGAQWPASFDDYAYHRVLGGNGAALDVRVEVLPEEHADGGTMVRFDIENVDDVPGVVDLAQIAVSNGRRLISPTGYRIETADVPDDGGAFTLAPGDRLSISLAFPVRFVAIRGFHYYVDGEAVSLTPCWDGCGPGLLPIIRISE